MFPHFLLLQYLLHNFLDLITSITLVRDKLRSTSLWNFLHSLVMLSLKPSPLLWYHQVLWYLLTVRYQVLHISCLATPTHHTVGNVTTTLHCHRHRKGGRTKQQRAFNDNGRITRRVKFYFGLACYGSRLTRRRVNFFRVWCKNSTEYGMFILPRCSFYRATSPWSLRLHVRYGTGHKVGSQQLGTQRWVQRFILTTKATDCLLSVRASYV